jgi:hypothetical protein
MRADCGGCHAHSQQPLAFAQTAAAQPSYQVWDLADSTPLLTQDDKGDPALRTENAGVVNVEFYRDIRPLLQAKCVSCHTQNNPDPPGNLVLDDTTLYDTWTNSGQQVPGDYKRLCQFAADRQLAADQRQPLRAAVPKPAQPAYLEDFWSAARWLEQQRPSHRNYTGG